MQDVMENAKLVVDKIGDLPAIPSVILTSMSMLNDLTSPPFFDLYIL